MKALAPTSNRWLVALSAFCLFLGACGGAEPAKETKAPEAAKPAAPAIPPEIQAVAATALGEEVTVLRHGDLAKTGSTHVLAANLFKVTPQGVAPGTLFTRLVILQQEKDKWVQVFRCDEYLKNGKGFLGGTPLAPISGWRLQHEMSEQNGLTLYFTPIQQPASGAIRPIGVRWNPKARRYQSLDRNYENFLGEVGAIDKPETVLR
jgi:hypothetical protein